VAKSKLRLNLFLRKRSEVVNNIKPIRNFRHLTQLRHSLCALLTTIIKPPPWYLIQCSFVYTMLLHCDIIYWLKAA